MARYNPPQQPAFLQLFDIACLVGAIFLALWFPLYMGWAGVSKSITKIENPTWELLHQTPAQVEQWTKLGKDVAAAHDIIQNRYNYTIDWTQLLIMIVVVVGYFVFLFRASETEYRDVIDEKFNQK